jgi:hypothetical protein
MLWLSMVLFVFWQCLCHPFCLDRKCVVMVMKFVETDKVDLMVGGIEWETKLIVKRTASDLKQHFFGWCLVLGALSVCLSVLFYLCGSPLFHFLSFIFISSDVALNSPLKVIDSHCFYCSFITGDPFYVLLRDFILRRSIVNLWYRMM